MEDAETKLYHAAYYGKLPEVKEILQSNPIVNVNWKFDDGDLTALHESCGRGHDSMVVFLLAHPDIDVNLKTISGTTPFKLACENGKTACVRLLLKDSRVNINESDRDGYTALRWPASKGNLDIIKWWIASGREMDMGTPGNEATDAIGKAKEKGKTKVVTLLERFKENPEQTRSEVRKELGITSETIFQSIHNSKFNSCLK